MQINGIIIPHKLQKVKLNNKIIQQQELSNTQIKQNHTLTYFLKERNSKILNKKVKDNQTIQNYSTRLPITTNNRTYSNQTKVFIDDFLKVQSLNSSQNRFQNVESQQNSKTPTKQKFKICQFSQPTTTFCTLKNYYLNLTNRRIKNFTNISNDLTTNNIQNKQYRLNKICNIKISQRNENMIQNKNKIKIFQKNAEFIQQQNKKCTTNQNIIQYLQDFYNKDQTSQKSLKKVSHRKYPLLYKSKKYQELLDEYNNNKKIFNDRYINDNVQIQKGKNNNTKSINILQQRIKKMVQKNLEVQKLNKQINQKNIENAITSQQFLQNAPYIQTAMNNKTHNLKTDQNYKYIEGNQEYKMFQYNQLLGSFLNQAERKFNSNKQNKKQSKIKINLSDETSSCSSNIEQNNGQGRSRMEMKSIENKLANEKIEILIENKQRLRCNLQKIKEALLKVIKKYKKLNLSLYDIFIKKAVSTMPYEKPSSIQLIQATKQGDFNTINFLLMQNRFLVYDFDDLQQTSLHLACKLNYIKIAKLLINYNSDIEMQDLIGRTPLFIAVIHQNVQIVQMLLYFKANPFSTPYMNYERELEQLIRYGFNDNNTIQIKQCQIIQNLLKNAKYFYQIMKFKPQEDKEEFWSKIARKLLLTNREIEDKYLYKIVIKNYIYTEE